MVDERKEKLGIKEYAEALDLIFDNNLTEDVVIRFESGGYLLCLEIRNDKTEIIIYKEAQFASPDWGDG